MIGLIDQPWGVSDTGYLVGLVVAFGVGLLICAAVEWLARRP